ncbi:MAG: 50S ribosomal protein L19e [Candidatus Aenigmarchaeota archaeon ex4484_224]|nr:MAG: 50S ribosomal protein L19e [Candidatus Aenigmarchaeota archaeon ex4484_224]
MTSLQKKLAAEILKVGKSRIWLDPTKLDEIKKAVTRKDIKKLISKGYIKVLPAKKNKRKKEKKRKGPGSRKGSQFAKISKKRVWINTIRPIRRYLRELKASGKIDNKTYRKLLALAKGGMFRSRTHVKIYLQQRGILKEE